MVYPRLRCVAVIAALLISGDAIAGTYHVAASGDDDNDGSRARPFGTLQKAADVVRAGDTVIVAPGRYQGFDLRRSGTKAAPIVFSARPGVVIDRENRSRRDGINLEKVSYVRVEGFTVTGVKRAGIRAARCDHVTIARNKSDRNGKWGIFTAFCDDLLIEANETSRSGREHGIYVSNSGDRPVIRRNVSWGNNAAGIHMNGDAEQGGDGIISDAVVEANVIFNNGARAASGINCDGVQSSIIRNNLLFDNQSSGISLYRINSAAASTGNLVINNTVIVGTKGRWALNIQNRSRGNKVFNNILLNRHRWRGSVNVSADSLPGYTADNNIVMDRFTTDDGDSRLSLAKWREFTKQDRHSKVATIDELFADQKEFRLKPGSPAVDAGKAVPLQLTDRFGTARPVGKGVDIGAHELCTSGACASTGEAAVEPSVPIEAPASESKRSSGCGSCNSSGAGGGILVVLMALATARVR